MASVRFGCAPTRRVRNEQELALGLASPAYQLQKGPPRPTGGRAHPNLDELHVMRWSPAVHPATGVITGLPDSGESMDLAVPHRLGFAYCGTDLTVEKCGHGCTHRRLCVAVGSPNGPAHIPEWQRGLALFSPLRLALGVQPNLGHQGPRTLVVGSQPIRS
jgi:hypothetical protein